MKTLYLFTVKTLLLIFAGFSCFAQTFTVDVQIKNQPENTILFGWVKGDDFTAIDSTRLNQSFGKIKFTFPDNAHPGVYRIILGTSSAGKIMNEGPQYFDFIFDDENIELSTDFKSPVENLNVIKSKENKTWFEFRQKDKVLRENIDLLTKEIDEAWRKGDTQKTEKYANDYNQLQMERDMFVVKSAENSRGLFASQMIKNQRLPLLEGYLTPEERIQSFKNDFFKTLDFSNADLIYSSVYTDNIFNYLVKYNNPLYTQQEREAEYIKALDIIVPNIKQNTEVYNFLMGYLVHGFTVLKMDNVISYISKKYNFPK